MTEGSAVRTESGAPKRGPAMVVGLGGLLMVLGPFLTFGKAEIAVADGSVEGGTLQGIDTADGKFFVFVGIAVLVMAAIMLLRADPTVATAGLMFVIFGSLLVLFMGVTDLFTLPDELRRELFRSLSGVLGDMGFEEFSSESVLTVHIGAGLFVVVAGALIAAIGGIMTLVARTRQAQG